MFQRRAHLVPSFSFGENEVYDQVDNPRGSKLRTFQDYLRKFIGLAPVLLKGRGIFQYTFGFIPNRRPITTVGNETFAMFTMNKYITCFSKNLTYSWCSDSCRESFQPYRRADRRFARRLHRKTRRTI